MATSDPFGVNPFAPATPAAPVLPQVVGSQYRIVGDYWTFAVSYLNLQDGTAAAMAGMTARADFLAGYSLQPISLTALAPVSGDPANLIRFGIDTDATHVGGVTVIPQGVQNGQFPLRLHAYLVDSLGHETTYALTPVIACDPRKVDINLLPKPSTIVAVAGPAGQQGAQGNPGQPGNVGPAGPPGLLLTQAPPAPGTGADYQVALSTSNSGFYYRDGSGIWHLIGYLSQTPSDNSGVLAPDLSAAGYFWYH